MSAEQESNTEESVVNIKEQESQLKNVAAYPQTESASERVITQKQAGFMRCLSSGWWNGSSAEV